MRRALGRLYDASLFLAGVFLVGIFVLMIAESVLRKAGSYVPGANELIGWFCAAAGFLALPATFKRGDMVRVGVLVDRLPPAPRKAVLLGALLLAAVFTAYMTAAAARFLWSGWRSEETTQGMIEVAVWIPQASFVVGVALLLVAVIDELLAALAAPPERLHAEKPLSADDVSLH